VAEPSERDDEPVREFPAFTADLQRLVQWLRRCRVTAVAMESTGVYWIPLFEMLDAAGFEVHLVNARHVRNVPGRKSDVLDCQGLQQLMSYGLLHGGFRPAEEVCALRAVWRHRDMLLSYQARHVQHLQKAMTQMNVQLHHVISDIMGVSGQAIVRAIVAGERDAATLAKLRDRRIKADEAEVAAALQGNWHDEHLFALKQALALIDAYAAQITECDGKLKQLLGRLRDYRDDVWRFMTQPNVPSTNNLAEQTVRMPKVKQKVSGCFARCQERKPTASSDPIARPCTSKGSMSLTPLSPPSRVRRLSPASAKSHTTA
jgi:transposase